MVQPATVEASVTAPEFVYRTAEGDEKRLSDLWRERPALIVWLRHFG